MMKRMACALALAAGTGLTLGVATHTALAQPNPATAVSGLKLSVAPLGSVVADTPVELNVNFRGGKVRNVEVYLDGNRIANETINTVDSHGVLAFKLPASLLPEGTHEITIQATENDGSTATTTTRLHVNAPAVDTIAHFLTPKRNALVNDIAPIEVKLDDSIKDAYVMFFLDGQFLSARNYSPYVYALDTSKYTNGDHTIKIEVWDSAGSSVLKTLSMPLKIHNLDGLTDRQKETRDLSKTPMPSAKPKTPDADAALPAAQSSQPGGLIDPQSGSSLSHANPGARASFAVRNSTEPRNNYTPSKSTFTVSGASLIGTVNPDLNLLDPENDLVRIPKGMGAVTRNSAVAPTAKLSPSVHVANGDNRASVLVAPKALRNPALPGVLADPSDLNALSADVTRVVHQSPAVHRAGNVAARPSTNLDSAPVTPKAVRAVPVAHASAVQVARAPKTVVGTRTMRNSHLKTFDVAFDNTQIAFDVPPRIENGMPLAPFRAIFEHSGGTVKWYGESKTVRAINNSKEIEIHIGENEALVNNQKVKLDAKAYIDRGRTIVPLSFVKDSMDVKVTYDAQTGHVLIESNK